METIMINGFTFLHPSIQQMSRGQLFSCFKAVCFLEYKERSAKDKAHVQKLRFAWQEYLHQTVLNPDKVITEITKAVFK